MHSAKQMINNRLMWILESNNLLSDHQAGFRKFRSTLYHLVFLEYAILSALNRKEQLRRLFLEKTHVDMAI